MVKMKSVSVVTDTTACIPREYVDRYRITIVPVQMIIDNRSYRDGIDITPDKFYTMLRQAEKIPTTSSSSPAPYLEAFKQASQHGRSIICLTEPAKFTAMFNASKIAREVSRNILPGITIEVIECSTAAAGLGLVALSAARLADDNRSLEDIITATNEIMPRVKIYAALDTLAYLAKSGRVPQAAAMVNSVLNLKPVFTLNHGDARTVALPTNTKNAVKRIMKLLEKEVSGARLHAAVMHADAPNPAQELLEQVSDRFRCEEVFITEFTPVMGTHTGPGLFGVAFYTELPNV
jgi:DegV family protein with EDD domain